ncbi:uncharacterized protein BROUX77_005153 [Berkeleyomyces rouxiae]|uniref:uncharacterized protein n=1 Tax=Berkeleyomyces rouxiae TaxID=2035830 RepID=UPI003B793FE6
MSTSSAPDDPTKPRKGLGKALARIKTVLRRGSEKRRSAILPDLPFQSQPQPQPQPQAQSPSQSRPEPTAAPQSKPATTKPATTTGSKLVDDKETPSGAATPKPSSAQVARPPAAVATGASVSRVNRNKLYEQRAKNLADKFGVTVHPLPDASTLSGEALRVEKLIRIRVHHTCHMCAATFGATKECLKCHHIRCSACTRSPPKQTEAEREENRERVRTILAERDSGGRNGGVIAVDWNAAAEMESNITSYKNLLLNVPSKVPGAPDLVYKKTRQRVRRTCHACQTQFKAGSKLCANCKHVRCTDCPRDPAKKDKYPFGYPGDAFGPSSIPVHGCHMCKGMFPAGVADGTVCVRCKHAKCPQCRRLRPRKVEPELDADLVRAVEEKLKALVVMDDGDADTGATTAKRPASGSGSEIGCNL